MRTSDNCLTNPGVNTSCRAHFMSTGNVWTRLIISQIHHIGAFRPSFSFSHFHTHTHSLPLSLSRKFAFCMSETPDLNGKMLVLATNTKRLDSDLKLNKILFLQQNTLQKVRTQTISVQTRKVDCTMFYIGWGHYVCSSAFSHYIYIVVFPVDKQFLWQPERVRKMPSGRVC